MRIEEFLIGSAVSHSVKNPILVNYKFALKREFNVKNIGISRFGLEKILELDIYRKHPLINFAKIFSSR